MITWDPGSNIEVVIIPEMQIASSDRVIIGYGLLKLALTVVVDFGIVQYCTEN